MKKLKLSVKTGQVHKDGSDDDAGNFKGKSRSNDTHESTADADARLYRMGNRPMSCVLWVTPSATTAMV